MRSHLGFLCAQAQVRLAAHLQAASALGGPLLQAPPVLEAWEQLRGSGFCMAAPSPTADAPAAASAASPRPPAPAGLAAPAPGPAVAAACIESGAALNAGIAAEGGLASSPARAGEDDSARYRLMLADLESSIDRWRSQLRWGALAHGGNQVGRGCGSGSVWVTQ